MRFGYLYLNNGWMNGRSIVPEEWVNASTQLQNEDEHDKGYGYLFWLPTKNSDVFMAKGFKGQYLVVNKKTRKMAVRMGTSRKNMGFTGWDDFLVDLVSKVE